MARSQIEFRLHCFVADTLHRLCRAGVLWTHFPAGENRSAITGARLKRMGLARGWPDFIFILPDGYAAFLELKRPGGKLSLEQEVFRSMAETRGCDYAVAETGEEAVKILTEWDVLRRVSVAA